MTIVPRTTKFGPLLSYTMITPYTIHQSKVYKTGRWAHINVKSLHYEQRLNESPDQLMFGLQRVLDLIENLVWCNKWHIITHGLYILMLRVYGNILVCLPGRKDVCGISPQKSNELWKTCKPRDRQRDSIPKKDWSIRSYLTSLVYTCFKCRIKFFLYGYFECSCRKL